MKVGVEVVTVSCKSVVLVVQTSAALIVAPFGADRVPVATTVLCLQILPLALFVPTPSKIFAEEVAMKVDQVFEFAIDLVKRDA